MFLIKWFGQSSVPASRDSVAAHRPGRSRKTRRRRSRPLSWEALEARQLLAHTTIARGIVQHPAALIANRTPAASRNPALDPTLETLFLEGVEREVVGITPSPSLVAPYVKMLVHGVPQVRVLQRLLDSTAARDATVTDAYELLLHRDPSAAERGAMATKLARGGDLRTLLVSLASSSEYYVSQGGGTEAGFLNALKADLLGPTAPMPELPGTAGRPGHRTRSALARAIVFSKEFNDQFLEVAAPRITGTSFATPGLIVQARNALQRPGGMTRALAILLASDPARKLYVQRETQAELPAPPNPTPSPTPVGASTPQSLALTVPTDFGGALNFNAVSYADTFSGQPAPTVALPNGLINQAGNQVTYEVWFNAQTSGALLQEQLSGNGQTFDVPILAVDANGKLTGGLFDVDASGKLATGLAGSAPSLSTTASSTTASIPITPTLPSPMTSPLTLDYNMNSQNNDNPYTYTIVGPNNAMVSAATVLDQNWHEAALVVGGYDLHLMFWGDGSGVPTSGTSLVIAGLDNSGLLHIRTFDPAGVRTDTFEETEGGALHLVSADASGKVLSDEPESSLSTAQSSAITTLKLQLPGLLPPHVLIGADRSQVLGEVSSIVGRTLDPVEEYLYLDGLLVGAAQPAGHYSLGFTDASGNKYTPTGAGFLGGTVDPLAISAAEQPPGIGYPEGFVGALSELRIWSVARTTAQVEQTMDAPLALDPTPPGLIGYYDFSQGGLANRVPGSPFGPATTDAGATGTRLSATDVVPAASTIPADPFGDVPRLPGYQDFAPYLAVPYGNSAPTVNLATGPNQVEYQVTLDVGDTVVVEVPGGQKVDGPIRVDFLGFTTNPADGSHPVLATYSPLQQISGDQALNDLIKGNMAAAFPAPASGTYLIRITGPAQNNSDNSAVKLQFSVLPGNSNSLLTLMGTQAVQGGGGTTVAAYTDPAAPPGATIRQLLPIYDPNVDPLTMAEVPTAYQALVQAGQDYVSRNYPSESFTDFLNLNTGVTITPQHLFGLQDQAYQAVTENPAKYLGTASPSKFLLSALNDVHNLLDTVNSLRQNVFAFLQVQDSWIQNEINNILGQNTLSTIAQTIVNNQSQDNPQPYLEPPPSTPYSMDADAAIQGGRQALAGLQAILTPLLFAGPAAPFAGVLFGVLNVGATIGATYASDTLKKTAAQMPTLIVPPDKNQISSLIQAASTYQAQLISGLNLQENLANEPQFYYPLFSNVGLLEALANLNPLVLSSTKADDQLGPNNPTAAAVTNAAWQTLLPDYFQWAPIDPTTESRSQNFNNFYPNATPASPNDALEQLAALQTTGSYDYPGFKPDGRRRSHSPEPPPVAIRLVSPSITATITRPQWRVSRPGPPPEGEPRTPSGSTASCRPACRRGRAVVITTWSMVLVVAVIG